MKLANESPKFQKKGINLEGIRLSQGGIWHSETNENFLNGTLKKKIKLGTKHNLDIHRNFVILLPVVYLLV